MVSSTWSKKSFTPTLTTHQFTRVRMTSIMTDQINCAWEKSNLKTTKRTLKLRKATTWRCRLGASAPRLTKLGVFRPFLVSISTRCARLAKISERYYRKFSVLSASRISIVVKSNRIAKVWSQRKRRRKILMKTCQCSRNRKSQTSTEVLGHNKCNLSSSQIVRVSTNDRKTMKRKPSRGTTGHRLPKNASLSLKTTLRNLNRRSLVRSPKFTFAPVLMTGSQLKWRLCAQFYSSAACLST